MKNKNTYEEFDKYFLLASVGDGNAKLKVIEMLNPLIIYSIKKYCPVQTEFEDLYSDGVEIILHLIETYDGKRSFLKYAKEYLKYHYLDTFKYLKNTQKDIYDKEEEQSIFEMVKSDTDIEKEYIEKEKIKTIKEEIKKLTPRQKTVIKLYYYKKLKIEEIAEELNISKWTVINLKRNAVKNLKEKLNRKI